MQSPSSCCIFAAESQLWTGKNGEDFDLRRLGADGWTARAVRLDASGRLTRRPGAFFFSTWLHLPPDPASSPSEPSFISFWTQLPIPQAHFRHTSGTLQAYFRHTLSILKQAVWVCLLLANSLRSTCHLRAKYLPSPCESNKKMDSVPLLLSRKKCSIRYRGSAHLR